jgi:hypothetical protein
MSILKNNLRLSGSSVQSDARSTNSRVNNRVCATFLAGLILFGGGAKAQNVLVNPGAETGNLTGWKVSNTGYIYAVNTNSLQGGAGSLNRLAHSGSWTFQLFDTTSDSAYIYQDFAADPGSQWSASCWTICYASNYFIAGASAHMQVVFYDVSNNVVVSPSSISGTAGVYGSDFLDPSGPPVYWIFAPPAAVDASGWVFLEPTNLYAPATIPLPPDRATEANEEVPLAPTNILTAPLGTAFVRYQIEFDNTANGGGAVYWDDCVLNKLVGSDPDITGPPVAVTTYPGLSASFTVVATHNPLFTGEKLSYQWQKNGTNLPAAGGVNDIAGSTTTATLSFANLQGADAGLFDVVVTSKSALFNYTNSIRSVPVALTILVLTPLQKVNALGLNSGFEGAPVWVPWSIFNGCNFASAANFYGTSSNAVNVYDGNEVALIGANGDRDNGLWQAVLAAPGTVWKAGGWAYISSSNDFSGGNTCRLQIWFKDSPNAPAAIPGTRTYESFKLYGLAYTNADTQYTNIDTSSPNYGQVGLHAQLPRDQWCFLAVSNVLYDIYDPITTLLIHNHAGVGLGDDIPGDTLPNGDFMVPTNATTTGTTYINFQVYEYCPVAADIPPAPNYASVAADAVYWDDLQLIQVVPVTNLTTSVSGNNINLSFSAGAGLDYSVLYKTNLTDATWSVLASNVIAPMSWQTNTASVGTSYPVTVSDPLTAHSRFYRVQVY